MAHGVDCAQADLVSLRSSQQQIARKHYGRGYSVREVIEAVRSVAGTDFEVHKAPRRAGDPASVIASNDQLVRLGWKPELDDLSEIVRHALAWEKSCAIRV
jgi:UDP-glucose 4-epimerase